jgi:hypothetical protein
VTKASPSGKVARATSFTLQFSERVTGVSATTLRVYRRGAKNPVPAKVTLSANRMKAVIDPRANLLAQKRYTVKATSGIEDAAGNTLVGKSWTVTVR